MALQHPPPSSRAVTAAAPTPATVPCEMRQRLACPQVCALGDASDPFWKGWVNLEQDAPEAVVPPLAAIHAARVEYPAAAVAKPRLGAFSSSLHELCALLDALPPLSWIRRSTPPVSTP